MNRKDAICEIERMSRSKFISDYIEENEISLKFYKMKAPEIHELYAELSTLWNENKKRIILQHGAEAFYGEYYYRKIFETPRLISYKGESSGTKTLTLSVKNKRTGEIITFNNKKEWGTMNFKLNGESINFSDNYYRLKIGDILTVEQRYYNHKTELLFIYNELRECRCENKFNEKSYSTYLEQYEVVCLNGEQNYCVYQITNDVNDLVYIGITNNFKKRKYDHFKLQQQTEKNLYELMWQIGTDHFTMTKLYDGIKSKRKAEEIETILININEKKDISLNQSYSMKSESFVNNGRFFINNHHYVSELYGENYSYMTKRFIYEELEPLYSKHFPSGMKETVFDELLFNTYYRLLREHKIGDYEMLKRIYLDERCAILNGDYFKFKEEQNQKLHDDNKMDYELNHVATGSALKYADDLKLFKH